VIVQVLVGDVGHGRHIVLYRRHAVLRQAMGGGLHNSVFHASRDHLGQIGLHLGRVGRGGVKPRGRLCPADGSRDRIDRAHRVPGRRQDARHQARRGGLAIRARDANDLELAPGIPT